MIFGWVSILLKLYPFSIGCPSYPCVPSPQEYTTPLTSQAIEWNEPVAIPTSLTELITTIGSFVYSPWNPGQPSIPFSALPKLYKTPFWKTNECCMPTLSNVSSASTLDVTLITALERILVALLLAGKLILASAGFETIKGNTIEGLLLLAFLSSSLGCFGNSCDSETLGSIDYYKFYKQINNK